jgi:hypothetical protein
LIPCPLPSHGKGRGDRNPSLRIGDGDTQLLVRCYAGCDARNVLDELRRRGLLDDRARRDGSAVAPNEKCAPQVRNYADEQHRKAAWMWSQGRPIGGTVAEIYLRKARGITCALPPTLAFLPPYKAEHSAALIAAFALPDEVEPGVVAPPRSVTAIHLTLLKPDGSGKADTDRPKLFVGSPRNLPIVLAPPNELLALAITEGIEDGLTAYQATGLGTWAAGSAGRMPALAETLPGCIECVTICAHADRVGQDGALALSEALDRRGIEVFIEGGLS